MVLWAALFFSGLTRAADPAPDAQELLREARLTQGAQEWKLRGHLSVGSVKHPFRLVLDKGAISYEFLDNGDTITLRLGEKGSTLEEKRGGKIAKVTPARFDERVKGTDIRYEDLALKFLYWKNAKVLGDEVFQSRSCWKVEARPLTANESLYSRVVVWIGKDDGALWKAESYDAKDKWMRRFSVREVMKDNGIWLLKKMRIESAEGRVTDPQPTWLQVDEVEQGPKAGG